MSVRVTIPDIVEILKRGFPLTPDITGVVITNKWKQCKSPTCNNEMHHLKRKFQINRNLKPFECVETTLNTTVCWEFYNNKNQLCAVACPSNRIIYTPNLENFKIITDYYLGHPRLEITLGADIELELSHYSPYLTVRAIRTKYNSLSRTIGADGTGGPLEIRVPPAKTPYQLRKNMQQILQELQSYRLAIRCVSSSEPLGGHIHICIENNFGEKLLPRCLRDPLAYLLDYFVGSHFIKQNEYKIRRLYGYGRLYEESEDAIRNTHAHSGIEYRTPSAFIIHDPLFFEITFEIVRKIIDYIFGNPNTELSLDIERGATLNEYVTMLKMRRERAEYFLKAFKKPVPTTDVRVLWDIISPRRRQNLTRRIELAEKFSIIGKVRPRDFIRFLRAVEEFEFLAAMPEHSIELEQNFYWNISDKFQFSANFMFQTDNNLIYAHQQPERGKPRIRLPYSLDNRKLQAIKKDLRNFLAQAFIRMCLEVMNKNVNT
ncbi:MAG: hypothetical protein DRN49_00070 [Thaumarchaeota archaeon]|nr:MAG: hypothetical protein DRN49_00070 [Nitrososphaerota archaeon]